MSLKLAVLLWLTVSGFWWFASVQCQDTTTSSMVTIANPNPNCFLDPTKQWDTSASNYADCTTEQAKAQGVTSCCKSGGKIGCCPADNFKFWRVILIVLGVSGCIALVVFVVFWCHRDVFPCLGTAQDRCYLHCWLPFKHCCCPCCESKEEKLRREKYAFQNENEMGNGAAANVRTFSPLTPGAMMPTPPPYTAAADRKTALSNKPQTGGTLGEGDRLSRGQGEIPFAAPTPNTASVSFAAPPEFRRKVKDDFFY